MQEQPLGTGDAVRAARAALEGFAGDVLVLTGDVARLTADDSCASSSTTHRARGGRGDGALVRAARRCAATGGSCATATVASRRSSRRGDATAEELELGEVNSGIYVFRADEALAGARPARAAQRPGRALPDRRASASSSQTASRSPCTSRRTRSRWRGSTPGPSSPTRRRRPSRPDQPSGTCSPASRSSILRRPGSSRTSRSSPT